MDKLKLLRGNAFTIVIPVKAYRADGSEIEDFSLADCVDVVVKVGVNALKPISVEIVGNNVQIEFRGTESLGWYQLDVTGKYDGEKWRFDNDKMLQIVEHSSQVSIPEYSIIADDTYVIAGDVRLLQASGEPVIEQSDWDETDESSPAYIKNKPNLSVYATQAWVNAKDYATQAWVTAKGYVTQAWVAAQGYATQAWVTAQDFVTQSWITAQGFYKKPGTGIPSSDLSSAVQTSLGKADTALQTQINADWNAASGVAKILNKPTIPAAQVNSDWNASSGVAEILNKPTIPTVPTNVSVFTNDAGYITASDVTNKEDKVTIESASGATLTAQVGKYYTLSNVGTLAITLPTCSGTNVQTVVFYMTTGSTPAVTFTSTHSIIYPKDFAIEANGLYEINAAWNGIGWVIGQLILEIPT